VEAGPKLLIKRQRTILATHRDLEEGRQPPPIPSCVPEFFGDTILVNGAVYPFVDVEPRRYRFRVLNGSNARFYTLKLVYSQSSTFPGSTEPDVTKLGPPFLQIGTEGGFLPSPVLLNYRPNAPTLLVAPAERADLIIDFSQVPPGSRLILYNDAAAPFPGPDERDDYYPGNPKNPTPSTPGYGPNTRSLMQFRVGPLVGPPDPPAPPLALPAIIPLDESSATTVRDLTLNEDFDGYGRLIQRLGTDTRLYAGTFARNFDNPATETPRVGDTEVWRIFNLTGDTHPIHFHLVNAQILERQPFDAKHYTGTPKFHGLNREWEQLLKRENLPYFHMTEFAHSIGEFASWKGDESRRRDLIGRIIGIISRRVRIVVGVLIDRSAYKEACANSPLFRGIYVNEYTTAGFMSLLKCANWADKYGVSGLMAFIFDNGNGKRPDFQRAFDICKNSPFGDPCHLGSITFADDQIVLPLQAADFIAYEVCKVYTDLKQDKRRFRLSLKQLLDTVPTNCTIGTSEALQKLIKRIEHVDRVVT
jgi:hypothetical protein